MKAFSRTVWNTAVVVGAVVVGASGAYAVTINFDGIADGTVIDSFYPGVTFSNPVGPASIFARSSSSAASPSNVVSVLSTGVPAFDARFGAVEAVFSSPQRYVSIDAAILRLPEGLGTPVNFPKLEIYNAGGFVTAINWNFSTIPQPGAGAITGYETLAYQSSTTDITKVRFFSGQPGGSPSNFGLFDNLTFQTTPIPEPSTFAALGLGLGIVGFALRRRSR